MKKHTQIYLDHFGYSGYEFMPCECCGSACVDVHHIEPRSKFGKTMKWLQDAIENLIGLCRICHDKAHDGTYDKEYLKEIHKAFMGS